MVIADIKGYEGLYSIYSDGRVWSYKSKKFLRQRERGGGKTGTYLSVILSNNGKTKTFSVHRLVADAFIPNPDEKPQVNHLDFNKHNNEVSNLEWCTPSENTKHAIKHGLIDPSLSNKNGYLNGEGNGRSKLTNIEVNEMRRNHSTRERGNAVWENYGISNVMYYNIISGRNWRDLS